MADLQKYKPLLHDNPLCGIDTYKDTLNLATGACTRNIKKLVLTGEEPWDKSKNGIYSYFIIRLGDSSSTFTTAVCTHYENVDVTKTSPDVGFMLTASSKNLRIRTNDVENVTLNGFTAYLTQQYANGTPVTIWYVLETATTETITVPSGFSGTEEGYLIQDGTPTPTNPIYPTANYVEIWQHSLRKLTTATDTFTTLPADIYADGNNATVGLKGNTVQSGAPTPDNPIMPQGCGDTTGNLVRFYQEEMQGNFYGVDVTVRNAEITLNGTVTVGSGHWVEIGYKFGEGTASTDNVVIPCEPETSYTIATEILDGNSSEVRIIAFGTSNENRTVNIGSSLTTTFSDDINRIFISLGAGGVVFNNLKFRVMFNKGLTPLSYEPYGYKLDISSANTTTPVYLGEVQTTRKIKRLVLTGDETWDEISGNAPYRIQLPDIVQTSDKDIVLFMSTHYLAVSNNASWAQYTTCVSWTFLGGVNVKCLVFRDRNQATLADFKAYLAQQYANGTPVTVWYVLETPKTAVVNEPLMKIGDYADTVSGITIPTITGKDTFDVETTLKPSEVFLSYTGWHDATVEEWDGSQWNE